MLIKIGEVAKLINRHPTAVDKYVKMGLLPKHCHRDKPTNTNFWCSEEITARLPDVFKYQAKAKSESRSRPKPNKKAVNASQRPPETTAQKAANDAFDLCVNN